jgi:hypothetical protein
MEAKMEEPLPANVGTQQDFDEYINHLPNKVPCKFMTSTVVDLCSHSEFACPFRGDDIYSFAHGPKKECKRPKTMHMKELLGEPKEKKLDSFT